MIKKLKRKFIILATISMFVLMTFLVTAMNIINYFSVVKEADATMEVISQPDLPFFEETLPGAGNGFPMENLRPHVEDFIPRGMSPEVPYESRFFTAVIINGSNIIETDVSRIFSVESDLAQEYVKAALSSTSDKGFIGDFRYQKYTTDSITRISFLDCGRKLDAFYKFMATSIIMGLLGCLIVFIVFLFLAERVVRPIAESYNKQKRFITDAGHEIKTPLTIINANLDLCDEDENDNEYLTEIRQQTKRLASLTNDLIYLSKMEESDRPLPKIEFDISELVGEIAGSFSASALTQNKDYRLLIQPELKYFGSPDAIRQVTAILLDNAMKYSPAEGRVSVELIKDRKALLLSVTNTTTEEIPAEKLNLLFDRFYRTDASRNSATGGHGIGLSIAKAVAEAHGGKISASASAPEEITITVALPC